MGTSNPNSGLADLGRLLQVVAGQNTAMLPNFQTVTPGLTSSLISGAFSPETMFASGMFTPEALNSAIDSKYNQLTNQYNQEVQKLMAVPFDATFNSLSINRDPVYAQGTEIGELMRDAVESIALGQATASSALQAINTGISNGTVPAEVAQYVGKIGDDLEELEKNELPSYRDAIAKYQYDAEQKLASAGLTMPTRQDARVQFYKDLGMPQLALLPDPTQQYELDPLMFADPKLVQDIQGQTERGTSAMENVLTQLAPTIQRQSTQGVEMARRTAQDVARNKASAAAEKAKQEFLTRSMPKDTRDLLTKGLDLIGEDRILGPFVGGSSRKKEVAAVNEKAQKEYDAVFNRIYANEMSKFKVPSQRVITEREVNKLAAADPRIKQARNEKIMGEMAMRVLQGRNAPKVAQAQTFLANAGITPFNQAMNQLLANAAAQGTKVKK